MAKQINTAHLPFLLDIAGRAVELDELDRRRLQDVAAYREAVTAWKVAHKHLSHVPRESTEWRELAHATAGEYGVLQDSKRKVANGRKRLASAVRRLHAAGGAA